MSRSYYEFWVKVNCAIKKVLVAIFLIVLWLLRVVHLFGAYWGFFENLSLAHKATFRAGSAAYTHRFLC